MSWVSSGWARRGLTSYHRSGQVTLLRPGPRESDRAREKPCNTPEYHTEVLDARYDRGCTFRPKRLPSDETFAA